MFPPFHGRIMQCKQPLQRTLQRPLSVARTITIFNTYPFLFPWPKQGNHEDGRAYMHATPYTHNSLTGSAPVSPRKLENIRDSTPHSTHFHGATSSTNVQLRHADMSISRTEKKVDTRHWAQPKSRPIAHTSVPGQSTLEDAAIIASQRGTSSPPAPCGMMRRGDGKTVGGNEMIRRCMQRSGCHYYWGGRRV